MSDSLQPYSTGLFSTLDRLDYSGNPIQAPSDRPHLFSYHITIHNHSDRTVLILARKWILTYENGRTDVIEGEKVIGKTPRLEPGKSFSYTSFHLVPGNARASGAYHGMDDAGERIIIPMPVFSLTVPAKEP